MFTFLSRILIPGAQNPEDPAVRRAYGSLCGVLGICLNLLLFGGKLFAGTLAASVAITADAFNNLSDAGSSLITLIGFRLAGRRPDRGHPFGHGRIEYVAGLAVAFLILLMGVELARDAVEKILHPSPLQSGWLPLAILAVSILVKLYMYGYQRRTAKMLRSAAMAATAADSLSDAVATAVVLCAALLARHTGLMVDGWCGLAVAGFIAVTGIRAARDTLNPLLGQAPDPDFVQRIREIVERSPAITGIHDLIVHDYGPGRRMVSLHGEVPGDGDLMALHDAVDLVERELRETLGCDAVIHMDPVSPDDGETGRLRALAARAAQALDPAFTIHDFRIVTGPTHTNLIFDVCVPADCPQSDADVAEALAERLQGDCPGCFAVITVDRAYL